MASPSPSKLLASKVSSIAPYCYEPAEWQGKDKMAVLVLRPSPHKITRVRAAPTRPQPMNAPQNQNIESFNSQMNLCHTLITHALPSNG